MQVSKDAKPGGLEFKNGPESGLMLTSRSLRAVAFPSEGRLVNWFPARRRDVKLRMAANVALIEPLSAL